MHSQILKHVKAANLLALLTLTNIHAAFGATTHTFPSATCATTLQACVTAAAPGDTVQVATNTPIDQSLTVDKSLTLQPAAGFSPAFNNGARILFLNSPSKANNIVFEGFTIEAGDVRAIQNSAGPFDIKIRDLTFPQSYLDRPPINISTNAAASFGPLNFEVANNKITIPQSINSVSAIVVNGGYATSSHGTIHDNTIVDLAGIEGAGILVANATSELTVDVLRNQITGNHFNAGIQFHQFENGNAHARIINNLVAGQVSESGQPGAIAVGIASGDATFLVANNTLVDSEQGISVNGHAYLDATWNGVIANNIVANIEDWGIIIEGPANSVVNENNLVFNAGMNFFNPGPGTLFVDPQFVGAGDYRLLPTSPPRDNGKNAHVPADILTDLAGMPRIQGPTVDMGTYENVPEPSSAALVALATLMLSAPRFRKRTVARL
jgi:hypothetical protein